MYDVLMAVDFFVLPLRVVDCLPPLNFLRLSPLPRRLDDEP